MIRKDERDGCLKTEKILRMAHGNSKPKSCIIDDQQLRSLQKGDDKVQRLSWKGVELKRVQNGKDLYY